MCIKEGGEERGANKTRNSFERLEIGSSSKCIRDGG